VWSLGQGKPYWAPEISHLSKEFWGREKGKEEEVERKKEEGGRRGGRAERQSEKGRRRGRGVSMKLSSC